MAKDANAVMSALQSTLIDYALGLWNTVSLNRDVESEPYDVNTLPAINLIQGPEDYTLLNNTLQDNDLQVLLTAYAEDNGVYAPDNAVNEILRQIQTAIFDPWYSGGNLLGLSYVWDLRIDSGGQIDLNSAGDLDRASRVMYLTIKYRSEHQALGG